MLKRHDRWAGARLGALDDGDCEELMDHHEVHLGNNLLRGVPDAFRRVIVSLSVLDLSANRLTALPDALLSLNNLTSLKLRANQLEFLPPAPAMADAFPHLALLDLGQNELRDLLALTGLHALHTLLLDGNTTLGGDDDDGDKTAVLQLRDLQRVHTVDMRKCRLRCVPHFASLDALCDLSLRSNAIASMDGTALASLRALASVDVADNALHSVDALQLPPALRCIDASYNKLAAFPTFGGAGIASLESLALSNNAIDALPAAQLQRMTALTSLNVSHNRLRAVPSDLLTGAGPIAGFRELLVADNDIDAIDALPRISPALRRFDAKGNRLTFADMEPFIRRELDGQIDLCRFYETVPQMITPDGIFLGSAESARNFAALQKLRITHVLNASFPVASHCAQPERFTYLALNLADTDDEDISRAFGAAHQFIRDALRGNGDCGGVCNDSVSGVALSANGDAKDGVRSRGVLIHCQAGVSRSVAIAASFLMARHAWSAQQALTHIQSKRPHAKPIAHFVQALVKYQTTLGIAAPD